MQADKKVVVGRLGAAHGVRGWLKIHSFTEHTEDLFTYGPLLFLKDGAWRPLKVKQWRQQGKSSIAQIDGCESREQVPNFTNCDVAILASQLPDTEANEIYWHQLEGLTVFTEAEENLGRIDHVLATGANDVLVVQPTHESIDDQERLIPYIDHVVKACDLQSACITVDWDSDF